MKSVNRARDTKLRNKLPLRDSLCALMAKLAVAALNHPNIYTRYYVRPECFSQYGSYS